MKDVASRAGVALKTVSRVVNGEPGVAPRMAERVRGAIDELGYRRNDSARILRKGQTASIGLILGDLGDPFYAALARAVEDVAHQHGALLITGSSDEDPGRERALSLSFCARRVDGLIIVPAAGDHGYLLPEIAAGTAVVFADRPPAGIDADAVLTDNVRGAFDGVTHLLSQSHRRIGFLGDAPRIFTAARRYQGYAEAMAAAGRQVRPSWVAMAAPDPAEISRSLRRMLDDPAPVTAVFCGNNRVTAIALRELRAMNRPLALVGFDDLELADLLDPAVTVVAQNTGELGRIAAERLFLRLAGDRGPARHTELPARLIARGSGEQPPR
jgi:LacI family transcriptional regulator